MTLTVPAVQGFDNFQGGAEQLLAWLTAILRHRLDNFARDFRQSEKRCIDREVPLQQSHDNGAADDETPSKVAVRKEEVQRLEEALRRPTPDRRRVAELRCKEGLPFDEVAARPGDVSVATDVYGLGAVLYECLTGRPPFPGDNLLDVARRVVQGPPPAPRALRPEVPGDLETVCLKCLRKDPRHRYETAADLARDLRSWLAGKPVQARPYGRLERLALWARRERRQATSLAVGLLLSLALLVTGVWFLNSSTQTGECRRGL